MADQQAAETLSGNAEFERFMRQEAIPDNVFKLRESHDRLELALRNLLRMTSLNTSNWATEDASKALRLAYRREYRG